MRLLLDTTDVRRDGWCFEIRNEWDCTRKSKWERREKKRRSVVRRLGETGIRE